jgi:hypothetical protein
MALITVDEVAKAAKIVVVPDSADEDQIQFFCDVVTSYIESVVGYLFADTDLTERLQADYDGIIRLTKKPVTAVTEIKSIAGATVIGWAWDGLDEVDGFESHQVVDISYSAGFTTAPSDLKNLALSVAARQVVNPNGIRQQTVGAISETFAAGDGMAGAVFFTPMENRILTNYLTKTDTWRLGPRQNVARTNRLPTL